MDQPIDPKKQFGLALWPTPFAERTRALCKTDEFLAWGGYSTVDVFSTASQEYFAIRNTASVYDLSPMVKYRVSGPDAERFLNRVVIRDVAKLKVGRVFYVAWCNDDGQVIDDGTIFRFGPTDFRLCVQERQLPWLLDSALGFDVRIEDVTEQVTGLSLQGPTSCVILKTLGLAGIETLKPFEIRDYPIEGLALTVSRTGFTGDLGYELWVEPSQAIQLWDWLFEAGKLYGLKPVGSQALNIARIEAGFILPNVDFISAETAIRPGRARTPDELGLDWMVDFNKGHFTGRRALLAERKRGPACRLVGIEIGGNKPAHNSLIYADKKGQTEIGWVTSAIWSPTTKRNIALAILKTPHFASSAKFWAEIYVNEELQWERRMEPAWVVPTPFFAPERRKITPALER
jgi:aminomethyltransferase